MCWIFKRKDILVNLQVLTLLEVKLGFVLCFVYWINIFLMKELLLESQLRCSTVISLGSNLCKLLNPAHRDKHLFLAISIFLFPFTWKLNLLRILDYVFISYLCSSLRENNLYNLYYYWASQVFSIFIFWRIVCKIFKWQTINIHLQFYLQCFKW